jgi:aspartyl-tRNA(Asn)/glutamyl-tRNA(Gln) amidotransferase subunit A
MVAGSVGADGGGSIRLPAAYCGVTGIKPTFGAVPVDGNIHGYLDLDALGPFARDSDDARLMLEALSATELPPGDASGLRVGLPNYFWEDLDPEIDSACRAALAATGWQTEDVAIDAQEHVRMATVLHLAIDALPHFPADVHSPEPLLRAYDRFASLVPAAALVRSDLARAVVRRSLADVFGRVDVLVLPTVPAAAPAIDNLVVKLPSGEHPPDRANVRQTGLANLAGTPAMNVPAGFTSAGLPIGLQLVGPWGAEARLLDAAKQIEQATSREFVDAVPDRYL